MNNNGGLLRLIGQLKTWKITDLSADSGGGSWDDNRVEAGVETGANVVSSNHRDVGFFSGEEHAVLLDLDVPAYLVPSSREGHSHLYIDVRVSTAKYFNLIDALAECGVIEPGYASASKKKGGTFLRLPWVKKNLAVA